MSLVGRISQLANRIGLEVGTKIDASHPGVAKAWVCFAYVGNKVVIRSAWNVAGVSRLASGRYRMSFASPMPDGNYTWTAQVLDAATLLGLQRLQVVRASGDTKTAQYVDVSCANSMGLTDADEVSVVVYR
jgi:hypothetical protein